MVDWFLRISSVLFIRYLVIAGLFFLVFYVLCKNKCAYRKIQETFPKSSDYQREITYSVLTTIIFALVAVVVFHPSMLRPYTLIYDDLQTRGWGYFVVSFLLTLLIHDTYFYWMHRLMHTKWGMKYIHITHHKSTNPSPWAAFAFHPLEAIIEAGIILVITLVMPVHALTVISFMIVMTIYNVYGHLGWELYPAGFHKTAVGRWINTSVNHNLHHKRFEGNYGLYFLIWDRLMGTVRDDYDRVYEEVTTRRQLQKAGN